MKKETIKKLGIIPCLIILPIIIVLALLAKPYKAYKINGVSMSPTLEIGDKIYANQNKEISRGDIVVYIPLPDPSKPFIHRVVALEKETIEIKNDDIYINDKLIRQENIKKNKYYTLGTFLKKGESFKVPDDHFFVLGDNSKNSLDSRFQGSIPKKNILGKAKIGYWPLKRIGYIK